MNNTLIEAIEKRRTQYALGRNITQAQEEITALIEEAIKLSPSAFNSQSSRAVILFGQQSEKFWHIVMNELRIIVPADKFAPTEAKIKSFAAGVGTILFYEDQQIITSLQQQYPNYAEQFPVWSEQGSGIAQFAVWSALANAGIGASLQHYNPLPDAAAAKEWQIPESWKLRAMMPFGSNEAPFPEKNFIDDTERFKVFY
ncbi:nitroreductase family protein [Snodgrassella alvi]|uniref:nitroreductase family protein n=1 Tax=Snodgrassella alvi TaxID=1196083 RepID=UPI0009FCF400|nr:nitroreductase family protein [Snodgrassella alvi]ORF26135.1 nitroreductase family protein [Snodgrassella alvi]ORF30167.1 nitroreductase family protein [Snodgrassella alvi]ORF33699.1 nitroreductase family protein [Snodgrassella alvi]ORF39971.1 nitroreductase family protein [Snodgrassella alvi]ORF40320.1 nitroreductase family protein [Snodgrassella alvi]